MIVFENVSKIYDGNVVGLQDVTFHIPKGEFVFVVGPSGSGKSTLIRMVLKELEPTKGRIIVAGRSLATLSRRRVPLLRRNIGCVFQDFKLLPNKTVYENVAYALEVVGEHKRSIRNKVPEILSLVGLSDKVNSLPTEISGGEEQRVSIARAFVNHPPLLLADEPTGNLDPDTSIGIMQLLERINRTGTTVLIATHDRDMVNRLRKRVFALDARAPGARREARLVRRAACGTRRGGGLGESRLLLRRGPRLAAPQLGHHPGGHPHGVHQHGHPGARAGHQPEPQLRRHQPQEPGRDRGVHQRQRLAGPGQRAAGQDQGAAAAQELPVHLQGRRR